MKTDVIIQWHHGAVPKEVLDAFTRPVKVVTFPKLGTSPFGGFIQGVAQFGPQPIRTYVRRRLNVDPLRIAAVGFSASCQGVAAILASQDAGFIDTAVAIDGIHGQVATWTAFAKIAAWGVPTDSPWPAGDRRLVITHSAVKPPYASTTETAARILDGVLGEAPAPTGKLPLDLWNATAPYKCRGIEYKTTPNRYATVQGGLFVLGYRNLEPGGHCDHIYQAKRIMPLVLKRLLVDRWNSEAPSQGTCFTV